MEKTRPATPEEIEKELQWRDILHGKYYRERAYLPALKEGYKDEVCLICGDTILACCHYVICKHPDCPMINKGNK